MKKENILIGAIAVIGLLTLFNTYSIFNQKTSRIIPAPSPAMESNLNMNQGPNNPSVVPQQNVTQPQQLQNEAPAIPPTSINFKESKKDFGKVLSTSTNDHTFVFTNTGTEPLVISNAKGSCGCTVPVWPKEPIAPGETGEIKVQYKPNGQSGRQTKQVTVTANTNPAQTILTITGDITPDPNAAQPAQPIDPADMNVQ